MQKCNYCNKEAISYLRDLNKGISLCYEHLQKHTEWDAGFSIPRKTEYPVKVHVEQSQEEIQDVYLLSFSQDVIVLHVNNKTKYLEADGYGSHSIMYPNANLKIEVPFERPEIISHTKRYGQDVIIINRRLYDDLTDGGDEGQTLFQYEK